MNQMALITASNYCLLNGGLLASITTIIVFSVMVPLQEK